MAGLTSPTAFMSLSRNMYGSVPRVPMCCGSTPTWRLCQRPSILAGARRSASTDYLPMILQPSLWRSIVPRSLRSSTKSQDQVPPGKSKEWNPATFFIVISILIGSQAIQIIALQREFVEFSNQTEAKLSLLREVVKKVQAGEEVDVEAMLGTGNTVKEREWEDVLRELEDEDALIQSRRQKRLAKKAAKDATASVDP